MRLICSSTLTESFIAELPGLAAVKRPLAIDGSGDMSPWAAIVSAWGSSRPKKAVLSNSGLFDYC